MLGREAACGAKARGGGGGGPSEAFSPQSAKLQVVRRPVEVAVDASLLGREAAGGSHEAACGAKARGGRPLEALSPQSAKLQVARRPVEVEVGRAKSQGSLRGSLMSCLQKQY